jgi:hypothetical protein
MLTQDVRHGALRTVGDHLHGIEQVLGLGGEPAKARQPATSVALTPIDAARSAAERSLCLVRRFTRKLQPQCVIVATGSEATGRVS